MKSSPTPTSTNPLLLPLVEDDFSFYFSSLQDAPASFPPSSSPSVDMAKKRRRRDGGDEGGGDDGGGGGEEDEENKNNNNKKKKRSIAKLLTSLAVLDAQEESDRRASDEAARRDLSLLQANHRRKSQAMLEYYSRLQDHFSDLDDSDSIRSENSRLAASATAAAATVASGSSPSAADAAAVGGGGQHHHRRLWVKDRSRAWWDQCSHPDYPEAEFRQAFRMGRATFDMICEELGSAVAKEDTMLRAAIPVRQRVAVCIWRLATGEPLRLVSKRFGLGISTCHKLVLEVCSAIKTVLMPRFLQWPDDAAAAAIKARFEALSGIPNVVGSMYTTHIPIIAPKISVAAYFNRRHTERNQKTSYSITVQGVVNPDGVFTDVCIGWPGSMPDDQVLEQSALYKRASAGLLQNSWVVGGTGYPLMDWVLVPYTHQNLTWTQHAFNEKIGEVQRVARDAFARLKGRWSCLQRRTEVKLQDLPVVLGACCVLHNICEIRNEEMDPALTFELVDDEMVPEHSLRSASSMQARDNLAHNLLHHGLAGTAFF
ncbi:protein ALP1-like [Phoenix dactylifera]|uniref:Protein ALP1-like n=1 Tax=Phoenix dactylifera TaxID=42345 RepID=A0A8B7CYP4_PHODC|nr:protein ALP1-like [Phoenix dactylifera]XP_038978367.1 protein ALP1-like [Phoenix dactylifera]